MVKFYNGDATNPNLLHYGERGILIAHLCNDSNGFGSGFAWSVAKKWPEVKRQFHQLYKDNPNDLLGRVQFIKVSEQITIANMIAMNGYGKGIDHVSYDDLDFCLRQLNAEAIKKDTSVVMPKIGSLRAGGSWPRILKIIEDIMSVNTYIYSLRD